MKNHTFVTKWLSLLFVAGLILSILPAATVQAAGATFTFKPAADAYVSRADPGQNFGSKAVLRVDGSPDMRAYLRFELNGLDGPVASAQLRFYAAAATAARLNVRAVGDTGWKEGNLNWRNAPQLGSLIREAGSVSAGEWISVDVTGAVKGNGPVSFAFTPNGSGAFRIPSREAANGNAPQLVVTTGGTPPPPTQTPPPSATPPTPGPTQTPPPTQPPPPTQTPPPAGDAVLVGAGDISVCGRTGDDETARLLDGIAGTVFTAGDNSNEEGTPAQFKDCYDLTWGRHKARIRPAPGNHDFYTPGGSGYFNYFGAAAGPAGKGYYSYNLGAWHVVVLNSNCAEVGGCQAGSTMERWLRADLDANPAQCTVAYWHHPRFSSGSLHGNDAEIQPLWQALYDSGAEIVLNGHDHHYERFAPQTPSGQSNPGNGIREFIIGTGGASLRPPDSARPNSEVRNGSTFGVLKLTLHASSYDWQFIPIAGGTFTDAGSGTCH